MTANQELASNPSISVWVSASAGTGKTKVLTDRVLRLLLKGVKPCKIMCLTFTKAAASEMSNRVYNELGKWVLMSDEELKNTIVKISGQYDDDLFLRARRLLALVLDDSNGLKIQTIHAFSQELVSKFPLESGIPPHFQVIQDDDAVQLMSSIIDRFVSEINILPIELKTSLLNIIEYASEGKFLEVINKFLSNHDIVSHILKDGLENAINLIYKKFSIDKDITLEQLVAQDNVLDNELRAIIKIAVEKGSQANQKIADKMSAYLAGTSQQRIDRFNEYKSCFVTGEGHKKESIFIKKVQDALGEKISFLLREQERVIEIDDKIKSINIVNKTKDLFLVGAEILQRYKKAKQLSARVDFSDLIHAAADILKNEDIKSWVEYKLNGGIEHLLVDEAQDTSPDQWQVIEALAQEFYSASKDCTLFVVGDEKQSIYSFQGADPKVFGKMQDYFSYKISSAQKNWHAISLDRSFRSTKAVLELVDNIFNKPELRDAVSFDSEQISHAVHRIGHGGRVELWPLVETEEKEELQAWPMPVVQKTVKDSESDLAKEIAETIKTWLVEKRCLASKSRPVKAGDIMILVQTRKGLVDYLVKYLKLYDVPVAGSDRIMLNDHLAIMDIMSLCKFLLLPHDDLNLAILLKTPLIGLSEENLFKLCYNRQPQSLWQQLIINKDSHDIIEIYNYLNDLLCQAKQLSIFELLNLIIEIKNGRNKLIARLGEQVNDPLDELLNLALEFEQNYTSSLQHFVDFMDKGEISIKRDLEHGIDKVRIMTVHGSKGLQAPIVFMPDTLRKPDTKNSFLINKDLENIEIFWSSSAKEDNKYCANIRSYNKANQFKEYYRLLYVALTRAEDELYICGDNSNSAPEDCWYSIIKSSLLNIGKQEGGKYVYECEQTIKNNYLDNSNQDKVIICKSGNIDSEFIFKSLAEEKVEESIAPSLIEQSDNDKEIDNLAIERGNIIHKLFEIIPNIAKDKQVNWISNYLSKFEKIISKNDASNIKANLIEILNDPKFARVFSNDGVSEIPIRGSYQGKIVSGRIDRLVILEDKVLVIDYKTSSIILDGDYKVPSKYLMQMRIYKKVLEQIYPDKLIETAILWTNVPLLQLLHVD